MFLFVVVVSWVDLLGAGNVGLELVPHIYNTLALSSDCVSDSYVCIPAIETVS